MKIIFNKTIEYFKKYGLHLLMLKFIEKLLKNIQVKLNSNNNIYQISGIVKGIRKQDLIINPRDDISERRYNDKKQYKIIWLSPPPLPGSGGQMTLSRYINFLEKAGHICEIYFYNMDNRSGPVKKSEIKINDKVQSNAEMFWLGNSSLPKSDAIFATTWKTAYAVQAAKTKAKNFTLFRTLSPIFTRWEAFIRLLRELIDLGFMALLLENG